MKNYLAMFLGSADKASDARMNMDKAKMQEGMEAWGKWMDDHRSAITSDGSPLGKTKKIDKNGISDTKNEMAAWIVVKAESYDEAAKMFENHPHFMIFPGDRVEVMECLPIPKME